MNRQELGIFIRGERMRQIMTQNELAEKAGIARQSLIELENSESNGNIATMLKVLNVLNFTLVPTIVSNAVPVYVPKSPFNFANIKVATADDDPDLQEQKKRLIFRQSNRKQK